MALWSPDGSQGPGHSRAPGWRPHRLAEAEAPEPETQVLSWDPAPSSPLGGGRALSEERGAAVCGTVAVATSMAFGALALGKSHFTLTQGRPRYGDMNFWQRGQ